MARVIDRQGLDEIFQNLNANHYQVVGPSSQDGAIVLAPLESTADLPIGLTEEQEGGTYRLKPRSDGALFGYTVGPHSWKKFLHPPARRLFKASGNKTSYQITPEPLETRPFAFIGVRACEIQAIRVQDEVFLGKGIKDTSYQARREGAFILAVNCGQAANTCFCVSMDAGPEVKFGYDLALTEIIEPKRHYFILEVGSEQGKKMLAGVSHQEAEENEIQAAKEVVQKTAGQMGRHMETEGIKELLYQNYEHPRWEEVAERCLSCANCTMVCPTCFCTTVEDVTDLTGEHAERWQKWDSCFTMDFSYLNGVGSVRASTKSRYRQWMTHKLATWIDQFGSSGCVGCGRCITWCPVAIDLTEEVAAIRGKD